MAPLSVLDAFRGRTVFLTGITGFVGSTMLARLLLDVPVKCVFVCVRPKYGVPIAERFYEALEGGIFNPVREKMKKLGVDFFSWVRQICYLVPADLLKPMLGVPSECLEKIHEEVDYVINCAADIKFTRPLKQALTNNVNLSLNLLDSVRGCRKLQAFIHVSTAYVFANNKGGRFAENLAPLPFDPVQLMADHKADRSLERYMSCVQSFPNTYTFSKNVCEHLLSKAALHHPDYPPLPLAIVRPSMIAGCWRGPLPGWTRSVAGVGAATFAVGMGFLTITPCKETAKPNFVPVDHVINCILTALPNVIQRGQDTGLLPPPTSSFYTTGVRQVTVGTSDPALSPYDSPSSPFPPSPSSPSSPSSHQAAVAISAVFPLILNSTTHNRPNYLQYLTMVIKYFKRFPPYTRYRTPTNGPHIPNSKLFNAAFHALYTTKSVALRAATTLVPFKKGRMLAKRYQRLAKELKITCDINSWVVRHDWEFEDPNTLECWKNLNETEREMFFCDIAQLDWNTYVPVMCRGILEYLNVGSPDTALTSKL